MEKEIQNKKGTLFFDMGNVILFFDHKKACQTLANRFHLSHEDIYSKIFSSGLENDFEAGKITGNQFYKMCCTTLKISCDSEYFRKVWVNVFSENKPVTTLIQKLKPGYELILLSNTNQWHFEQEYNEYEVIRLFDKYVLSYNVGCLKPDKEIYESALTLASNRNRLLYIDDIAEYVAAAQSFGIKSFHFKDAAGLEEYLKENKFV